MDPSALSPADLAALVGAGAAAGLLVGLIGVGGGVIYGPVLLAYYTSAGVRDPLLTPLVLGTSLLCVGLGSFVGAVSNWRAGRVRGRVALVTGAAASLVVAAVGRGVTASSWYDARAFQLVLGVVLIGVVARMLLGRGAGAAGAAAPEERAGLPRLAGVGVAAGALAALAGVGGGVILIPLYHDLVRLPLKTATGTSTAAIVLISLAGVATYVWLGLGQPVPSGAWGYVDLVRGLALVAPALVTAPLGVRIAQRADVRWVRYGFAAFAAAVAARLLWNALAG